MGSQRVIAVRNTKTVYRDEDRCIKVFNQNFSKADILNEALNQARIEETGLHIPKVLEVSVFEGKWAIVSEYISGKTLEQLMQQHPEKKEEYLQLLVDLQLRMHHEHCPLLNRQKDKIARRISESELDATTRYALHARLENMPKRHKVCHGDFNPSNIVITAQGIPYILDWSHASQGSGAADAAITYLQLRIAGDDEGAAKYLEFFCAGSGMNREYFFSWIPVVAAAKSVRCLPDKRDLWLKWVGVSSYD